MTSLWRKIWRLAISNGVPRRSLSVAIVVGSVLNLINQGDVLLGIASVDWLKLLLTYLVPYCVSTYGAVSYRFHLARHLPGGDIERPF
jgi:hypothetical protein